MTYAMRNALYKICLNHSKVFFKNSLSYTVYFVAIIPCLKDICEILYILCCLGYNGVKAKCFLRPPNAFSECLSSRGTYIDLCSTDSFFLGSLSAKFPAKITLHSPPPHFIKQPLKGNRSLAYFTCSFL